MSEITAADNDHRMRLIHSQYLSDLIIQILYIITVSLLPKSPEIIQILPNLRGCHLHLVAQLSGRNTLNAIIQ